MIIIIIKIMM